MGFIGASYKTAVTKLILLDEIPLYDFFLSRQFVLISLGKVTFGPLTSIL